MNILVIAATIEEIKPSIDFLKAEKINYIATGVGMVSTAYSLTKALAGPKVDLVVQVGIGGVLDEHAGLGEIYHVLEDEIFELGAEDHDAFIPIEDLGFGKSIYADRGVVPPFARTLKKAKGITVNKVHGSLQSVERLRSKYDLPLMESMEGAAAAFVAEQERIQLLQFRSSSNFIEPRNRAAWQIAPAIQNINSFLQELLKSLS